MKALLLAAGEPHFELHLRTLQELPEVTSVVIQGDDEHALAALRDANEPKVCAVVSGIDELSAHDDIFFAITTLPNDVKPDILLQLLDRDIHILAEKPIGKTAGDVKPVVDRAKGRGLQLGVCYQNRYQPLICQARSLIQQGLLGDLMSVDMRMLTTQVKYREPDHWMFNRARAGGGMLAWLGCHYIDLMRFMTGDEIVSVAANIATRAADCGGNSAGTHGYDVEDVAAVSLRFASGAIGTLHVGYTMALSGPRYKDTPVYDTYGAFNGTSGRANWSSDGFPAKLYAESGHVDWAGSPQREFEFTMGQSPSYGGPYGEAFLRDFLLAAQGKGPSPATGDDALQVARIVDAAYESSRTGRRIDVELPRAD